MIPARVLGTLEGEGTGLLFPVVVLETGVEGGATLSCFVGARHERGAGKGCWYGAGRN